MSELASSAELCFVCVSRVLFLFFDARMMLVSPIRVCTTVCRARWHVLALKKKLGPAEDQATETSKLQPVSAFKKRLPLREKVPNFARKPSQFLPVLQNYPGNAAHWSPPKSQD